MAEHGGAGSGAGNSRGGGLLAGRIALRYVSVGRRSQLVNFMSILTIGGLALSVSILVTVLSVMNGFDREMRENVLGVLPHAIVNTEERPRSAQWQAIEDILRQTPGVVATAPVLVANGVLAAPGSGSRGVLVNGIN